MKEKEHYEILKSLYPVGRERWIKVRYKNLDLCIKNLRPGDNDLGFEVISIGVIDDFDAQSEALIETRKRINELLDHEIEKLNNAKQTGLL